MSPTEMASFAVLAAKRAMEGRKPTENNEEKTNAEKLKLRRPRESLNQRNIAYARMPTKKTRARSGIARRTPSLLLDLPRAIRYQIYRRIADISEGWISLDGGKDLVSHPVISFYSSSTSTAKKRVRDALVWNLSRVCRVVYEDISHLVYTENFFHLGCFPPSKDANPLLPLERLRPRSVSLLNYLVIRLNPYSMVGTEHTALACHHQRALNVLHQMQYWWKTTHWYLQKVSDENKVIVDKWVQAAEFLALHIKPYTLNLRLICDTDDYTIAEKVTGPFFRDLKLKSCSIRLSRGPVSAFKTLARRASRCAMGLDEMGTEDFSRSTKSPHDSIRMKQRSRSTKDLMDLPKELRLLILSYSDLVTPLREVYWTSTRKFHLYYPPPGHGFSDKERNVSKVCRHDSCKFRMCQPSIYSGCLCRRWHGAYSPDCSCWEPPVALFLVCKELRLDAIEIFYRKNRLIIVPSPISTAGHDMENHRIDIDQFLRSFVPHKSLRFITYLQVALPPLDKLKLQPDTHAYKSWSQTIDFMPGNMNIPNLTLELCPWTDKEIIYEYSAAGFFDKDVELYNTAFQPLENLKDIKSFTLHMASPGQRIQERAARVKNDIELRVLKDNYETAKRRLIKESVMVGLRRLGRPT